MNSSEDYMRADSSGELPLTAELKIRPGKNGNTNWKIELQIFTFYNNLIFNSIFNLILIQEASGFWYPYSFLTNLFNLKKHCLTKKHNLIENKQFIKKHSL